MSLSVLQHPAATISGNASTTTVAQTITISAGSLIQVVAQWDGTTTTATCSDNVNGSYGAAAQTTTDSVEGKRLALWHFENAGSGSTVITVTFSANVGFPIMIVQEIGGALSSGALDQSIQNIQAPPITTPNGMTSNLLGTLSNQPALIFGVTFGMNDTTIPTVGTGFTLGTNGSDSGAFTRAWTTENMIVSSTAQVAATWTAAAGGTSYNIIAVAYLGLPLPIITSQPTRQTVSTGSTATFNVSATGTGTLHYQWTANGSNVGTDSTSYTTGTLDLSDNGTYINVIVTDDNGFTNSNLVALLVIITPFVSWLRA